MNEYSDLIVVGSAGLAGLVGALLPHVIKRKPKSEPIVLPEPVPIEEIQAVREEIKTHPNVHILGIDPHYLEGYMTVTVGLNGIAHDQFKRIVCLKCPPKKPILDEAGRVIGEREFTQEELHFYILTQHETRI